MLLPEDLSYQTKISEPGRGRHLPNKFLVGKASGAAKITHTINIAWLPAMTRWQDFASKNTTRSGCSTQRRQSQTTEKCPFCQPASMVLESGVTAARRRRKKSQWSYSSIPFVQRWHNCCGGAKHFLVGLGAFSTWGNFTPGTIKLVKSLWLWMA